MRNSAFAALLVELALKLVELLAELAHFFLKLAVAGVGATVAFAGCFADDFGWTIAFAYSVAFGAAGLGALGVRARAIALGAGLLAFASLGLNALRGDLVGFLPQLLGQVVHAGRVQVLGGDAEMLGLGPRGDLADAFALAFTLARAIGFAGSLGRARLVGVGPLALRGLDAVALLGQALGAFAIGAVARRLGAVFGDGGGGPGDDHGESDRGDEDAADHGEAFRELGGRLHCKRAEAA